MVFPFKTHPLGVNPMNLGSAGTGTCSVMRHGMGSPSGQVPSDAGSEQQQRVRNNSPGYGDSDIYCAIN